MRLVVAVLGLLGFACLSHAASVKLEWDASPSTNVVGYKVYWGGASRLYTNSASVSNSLALTVSNLVANTRYYFAATAYDANGVESDYSTEAMMVPSTNVLTFSVSILSSTNVDGPYLARTNAVWFSVTNPVGMEFIRSKVGVAVTNVAR